jgi:hypothetical protein
MDVGHPGDLYLDLADPKAYALYTLTRAGWRMWDPLPTQSGAIPRSPEYLAHPDSAELNRYLWCDGNQVGWYALSGLGGKRSRMRQDGMYRTKDGLAEEYNSKAVAAKVIRRMLDAEETGKVRLMGRRKRPSSSLKGSEAGPKRKKAKTSTHSAPSIVSISKAEIPEDKPLSWKIKFTPYYNTPASPPALLNPASAIPTSLNDRTSILASEIGEDDVPDLESTEGTRRMKDLIQEKGLYEEENERLKERVLQLTKQTDRLRETISKCSCGNSKRSSGNFQPNSVSPSTSAEVLNPIVITSTDMVKTVGTGAC